MEGKTFEELYREFWDAVNRKDTEASGKILDYIEANFKHKLA